METRKMKILLISIKSDLMPVGLAYISAALKRAGHDVEGHAFAEAAPLKRKLSGDYDFVATGGLSSQYHEIEAISEHARACGKKIIMGGGIISSEPELMARALHVNYAVIGEGEITIVALLEQLARGGDVAEVEGIGYFKGEEFILTPGRKQCDDLDRLPVPNYEGLHYEEFLDAAMPSDMYNYDIFDYPREYPIVTSRSCPFMCTFCYHPVGEKYRQRSIDSVIDELAYVIPKYRINIVSIYDELFSYKEERAYEFCRRFGELVKTIPWDVRWACQMRVSGLKDDMLDAMRDAGCYMVSYGFESYNSTVLRSMKKAITPEQIHHAVHATLDRNISIQANFIFGDPVETVGSVKETLEFWKNHKEAGILLGFIFTCPNSERYQQAVAQGLITDRLDFIKNHLYDIINMTEMSDDDFLRMKYLVKRYTHLYCSRAVPLERSENHIKIKCPHCRDIIAYKNFEIPKAKREKMMYCRSCRKRFYAVGRMYSYVTQLKGRLRSYAIYRLAAKLRARRRQKRSA